jgi:hypothetical protein
MFVGLGIASASTTNHRLRYSVTAGRHELPTSTSRTRGGYWASSFCTHWYHRTPLFIAIDGLTTLALVTIVG